MIVVLQPAIKVFDAVSIIALLFSLESYFVFPCATVTEVRPEQPENAPYSMLVTLLGMVTEVRPEQPENAPYSMLVTLLGIVTEVRPEQPENA